MNDSCPVPTPVQRQYLDIQDKAQKAMLETIYKAIGDAAARAAEELRSTDWPDGPPAYEYFAAVAHQKLFLLLCGADLDTMRGGDRKLAGHILENGRNIAEHYFTDRTETPASGGTAG